MDLQRLLKAIEKQWRILVVVVALLIGTYAAIGFLLVPYVARSAIEKYVTQDLKRRVAIEKISFNPFTFTSEIQNFALTEADSAPIASFDFLRINFQISSIVFRAWTFREIRIDHPDIQTIIDADGFLNLAKLRSPQAALPPTAAPVHIPALRIATLAVHSGRIGFEDRNRTRRTPFVAALTPIEFTLTDFRTEPNFQNVYNFEGTTLAGEHLAWSGQFSVQPPGSNGRFEIGNLKSSTIAAYLGDALGFDLRSGFLDLQGGYRLALSDKIHFDVDLPALKLRDLGISPSKEDAPDPWIRLPLVEVSNSSFSLQDHKARIGRIQIDQAHVIVWREADGQMNLARLLGNEPLSAPAPASPPVSPVAAWDFSVGTIAVQSASVDAQDRTEVPPVQLSLTPVSLTISGYSNTPGNVTKADVDITAGEKGRLTAQGDFTMAPMTANVTVNLADFDLTPLQSYFIEKRPVKMSSGQASLKGALRFVDVPAKGEPRVKFTGEMAIANVATRDTDSNLDFAKWQLLQIMGIRFSQSPDRVEVERIEARQPYGRFIVSPEQKLNIAAILGMEPGQPVPAPSTSPAMPMVIRSIIIHDGTSDFTDFSVEPNFSASIFGLDGSVTGLSSDLNSRADVRLDGSVDRYSPVEISGQVNLLSAALYTELSMKFRNMELTTFNPYSGKYAGYSIRKGKLTTELEYKVDNRKLDARHHVVLDQLEFGAATNSKAKVPLPIKLAAALLKDRHGVIDLNVPVSGSIDDPKFRLGPIIWQAFKGLLDKIVTAPFKLLGALFGKGEELAYVDFSAGSAALTPEQQEKVATLAKAMIERPEIRLDVPLRTLTPADDTALARSAYNEALTAVLPPAEPGTPVTREQRLAALELLYQSQMGAAPVYPMPAAADADIVSINITFLEDALRPRFTATPAQREQLARARADAVQSAVLNMTPIDPERVFLSERDSGKASNPQTVRMELELD